MEVVKLTDFRENATIINQIRRGREEKNSFDTAPFMEENSISLDLTYMFDTPGANSISKKDIEAFIPRVLYSTPYIFKALKCPCQVKGGDADHGITKWCSGPNLKRDVV